MASFFFLLKQHTHFLLEDTSEDNYKSEAAEDDGKEKNVVLVEEDVEAARRELSLFSLNAAAKPYTQKLPTL